MRIGKVVPVLEVDCQGITRFGFADRVLWRAGDDLGSVRHEAGEGLRVLQIDGDFHDLGGVRGNMTSSALKVSRSCIFSVLAKAFY